MFCDEFIIYLEKLYMSGNKHHFHTSWPLQSCWIICTYYIVTKNLCWMIHIAEISSYWYLVRWWEVRNRALANKLPRPTQIIFWSSNLFYRVCFHNSSKNSAFWSKLQPTLCQASGTIKWSKFTVSLWLYIYGNWWSGCIAICIAKKG